MYVSCNQHHTMETTLMLALVAGPIGILAYGVVTLNRAHYLQLVDSTQFGENNDSLTKQRFLDLLERAEYSIIIYDDGNKMPNSIYADSDVLGTFRQKLQESPGFQVRCLFNCNDPSLPFRKEFFQHPSVEIRTRNPNKSEFPIHYKIIDEGDKAYLSRHDLGKSNRKFQIVDCTAVPKRHRKYVRDTVLREYKQDFRQAFTEATG